MIVRRAARQVTVSVAAAAAIGAMSTLALAMPAGAAGPAAGTIVPNSLVPQAPFAAGTPFSSGQSIDVVVPANSVFNSSQTVNVVECSAPNGVIPALPSACNGNTIQGQSVFPNADGSIDFQTATNALYPVFFTPDAALGDQPGSPKCGNTAATECILYIGQNQTDFTAPHVWSTPFFINPTANDAGTNPGDGSQPPAQTPEVPLAVMLPVAGLAVLGGTLVIRRRRAAARA
jgi:hypothetical protein